ncbi:MAG: hypothetical protein A2087_11185 [Spirochaetes bacterium GWD1_61_31]|nr:MAG: hypothetical protein A2Y37_04470 [Spirochaetes bacterium GWB1_60_80]OHD32626.1 MAG: hypothetical protein A2004_05935 [Spirochaetes bacterium GWC1_61_12]OHD35727.1 MAG: hypothetical protein A2087_11185 [Spirochaetes bacterium GWD1_61_31]OHD41893.1 MAG: hypothetical protein A2Y35_04530 [Spirochaetes bacterium GWE1_60_18]OHD57868.1 MAG: hypothetical protein A2Y32_10800 [Spirochaetes bacterium GWF1_60_12]HAP44326.1 hypothetical protein [Spirochaetaceae bacterium]
MNSRGIAPALFLTAESADCVEAPSFEQSDGEFDRAPGFARARRAIQNIVARPVGRLAGDRRGRPAFQDEFTEALGILRVLGNFRQCL